MSAAADQAVSPVPTGNTFDKYGSSNPAVRRMMAGFERSLCELIARAAPTSILDVGCGEGILTFHLARRLGTGPVVGLDLPDARLQAEWRTRRRSNLRFVTGRAEDLPFAPGQFDLVAVIETLEHVPDPEPALAEMVRVAGGYLLVSAPREPLWRALNVTRGAYVKQLGNTPGHVNHWSRRGLERLLSRHGDVVELRAPFPWTMALVRVR